VDIIIPQQKLFGWEEIEGLGDLQRPFAGNGADAGYLFLQSQNQYTLGMLEAIM
jgi:hypothetical protein